MVYRGLDIPYAVMSAVAYPYLFKIAKFRYQGLAKHFH